MVHFCNFRVNLKLLHKPFSNGCIVKLTFGVGYMICAQQVIRDLATCATHECSGCYTFQATSLYNLINYKFVKITFLDTLFVGNFKSIYNYVKMFISYYTTINYY